MTRWRRTRFGGFCCLAAAIALIGVTAWQLQPLPVALKSVAASGPQRQVVDRNGILLAASGEEPWNRHDSVPLYAVPEFLQQAFVLAEDQRFYQHGGMDWAARLHALGQNLAAGRAVRGASTLTEQVVRLLHPRPRTLWTRWLEGWEAARLERRAGKSEILEFYLNQVPYASNRRGVVQAAAHYFNRDLDTLSRKEMLALAVLVRAPSRLDPYRRPQALEAALGRLAARLAAAGVLDPKQVPVLLARPLRLEPFGTPAPAYHFSRHVLRQAAAGPVLKSGRLRTTLDAALQKKVSTLLDRRVAALAQMRVHHGGALVADYSTGEILAWGVAGEPDAGRNASYIDAVTVPRQPGSALKPFLYALALERGWTAATVIPDTPLTEMIGAGLHRYHNYSRRHYGPVTLRQALGNSLNIPAVRAVQFVGGDVYLARLRALGFRTLDRHPDFYGDGLALGNGEVTLLELVQAYAALAHRGVFRPLTGWMDAPPGPAPRRVFSAESASLIADVLSDPQARALEFGESSVLNLPVQTAVKTGTSSDYRDAWAVGFNDRYVVGVWLGNLDARPTDGLTGSTGPALVLRAVFAELNRHRVTQPLYLSPRLIRAAACLPQLQGRGCRRISEWFLPGTQPVMEKIKTAPVSLRQPTPGLQLARDPRIPDDREAFEFLLDGVTAADRVIWRVDGAVQADGTGPRLAWTLAPGPHRVRAEVWREKKRVFQSAEVPFFVR